MVKEKFLWVDGSKIRYLESGTSKDALVLIHGLGASAERWDRVIPLLEDDYRVVVPDLIGFGYSDKPLADYTPKFFSDFIEKFFAACNLQRPAIVGSSLGGQIAAEYASSHPSNIEKLVLVSPAGMMKQSTPALDAYIMAAMYPGKKSAKRAFEMMDGSGKSADEAIINGFVKRMRMHNAKMAFMSTLLGLKNSELITSKLQAITAPVLIVWGSDDPVIPIVHAAGFVSSIRNCRLCKMDGCGHTPYVHAPHAFAAKVLEFLNGT